MGERCVRNAEVGGSTPPSSTIPLQFLTDFALLLVVEIRPVGLRAFLCGFFLVCGTRAVAQETIAVQPVRVCSVLQDPRAYTGKVVAVVGRYSFRHDGRFLSEEICEGSTSGTVLPVSFSQKLAPPTPEHLEFASAVVRKLLKQIQQTTALAKFRFGTPDFDRWAVVYGRIEADKQAHPLTLICAGEGVVLFIVDRY